MVERDQWGGVSDRRRDPGRRRAPGVVPAEHERPALHLPLLQLDLGRRHRQRRLPAEVGRQRARRDGRQGLGRRLHGRHQPEHGVPLRRRPGRQVPDRRGLPGGDGVGAGRDRRALPRRGQARRPELRLLEGLPGGHQRLAAARRRRHERELRQGRHDAPTEGYDRDGGLGARSCSRSRTPRRRASSTSASRTRPTTTARPPASATRRCCWRAPAARTSRCTATTRTRTGSRSTTTRSARPRAPRRARRAASTGACSPTASST